LMGAIKLLMTVFIYFSCLKWQIKK
jgi:hypothetical protein